MLRKIIAFTCITTLLLNIFPSTSIAGHAIILTDYELDQIHAGGLNFNFDNFYGSLGNTTTTATNGSLSDLKIGSGSPISITPNSSIKLLPEIPNKSAQTATTSSSSLQTTNAPALNLPARPNEVTGLSPVANTSPGSIDLTNNPSANLTPSLAEQMGNPDLGVVNITSNSNVGNTSPLSTNIGNNDSAQLTPAAIIPPVASDATFNTASNPASNNLAPLQLASNTPANTSMPSHNSPASPVNNSVVESAMPGSNSANNSSNATMPINDLTGNNSLGGGSSTNKVSTSAPLKVNPIQFDIVAGTNGQVDFNMSNNFSPTDGVSVPEVPIPEVPTLPVDDFPIPNIASVGNGTLNILDVSGSSQQYLSALVNVNAAGSVVPVLVNLTIVINSSVENLSNLNSLNLQNFTSFQFQ